MTNNKIPDDELLSAYVDGELTGKERAQVEERLQNDPEARQMVAELQELSQTLRSLPHETVGQDLRDVVLQRRQKAQLQETSSPRRWIWAVMAVAATSMLMVFLPETQQEAEQQLVAKVEINKRRSHDSPQMQALANKDAEEEINPAEEAFDEVAQLGGRKLKAAKPDYEVHVVFSSREEFRKLLAAQGLSFESTRPRSGLQEGAEQFIIEAPSAQIDRFLTACASDAKACQSLRILGVSKKLNAKQLESRPLGFYKEEKGIVASRSKSAARHQNFSGRSVSGGAGEAQQIPDSLPAKPRAVLGGIEKPIRVLFILREASAP